MVSAEGDDRDDDGHADESAEQAPKIGPQEDGEQHDSRRHGEHGAGHARLDIAADHELDDVKADENADDRFPRCELSHRQQGWKERGDEWADERDVVKRERDDAPFEREWQSGKPGARLISVRTSIYLRSFTAVAALPCRRMREVSGRRKVFARRRRSSTSINPRMT